ncbi:MAG TPA: TaqI-like C-terminal specificity domain-containing protein, partial [Aggregatilineales bacterium]|nr:TaqI-like C-terminal specificity domain-containing protein [Aggregatilineales bacterium]
EERAKKRSDKGEFWWELRPCAYYDDFEKPKIIYAEIARNGKFILDLNQHYSSDTTYIISKLEVTEYHYLLGILNSELFTKIFSHTGSQIRGGYLRWKGQYMEKMPIPTASETDRARLIGLVQKQLAYHAELGGLEKAQS